jgi:hypothetical protein
MERLSQSEKVPFSDEKREVGGFLSLNNKIDQQKDFEYQFRFTLSILTALKWH